MLPLGGVLIPDLKDGVAYTTFLNELNGQFKFFVAEQKETFLVEALRKVTDFIRATEIYIENTDALKKANIQAHRDVERGDRSLRPDTRDSHLTTDLVSVLMEVKGQLMLRRP